MTKSKRLHLRRKSRRFRKSRKNRTRRHYPRYKRSFSAVKARGLTPISPLSTSAIANVPCSMCDREFPRNEMMIPVRCLQQHGERAHRICQDCWWDPQMGFAREDAPHGCPGCKRGLPLNPLIKSKKPTTDEIIVISDSD